MPTSEVSSIVTPAARSLRSAVAAGPARLARVQVRAARDRAATSSGSNEISGNAYSRLSMR